MSVQRTGINDPMSLAATYEEDDALATRLILEAEERRRRTLKFDRARIEVAEEAGIAPGTIENLQRGRHKGLRRRNYGRIMQFVVRDIQSEITRLEHDLELALRSSSRQDEIAVCEARTALATARRFIEEIYASR
jgi:hypothetical protein